ncbi:MAG: hypothetical protein JWR63_2690 [Conexibacter sp.]|nr:hypothetical protein [Conexibacter sp.]
MRNLETADMVLCDISALNANVFFEFGIRTALDRPICLIRDEYTRLPFDIGGINCHQYASTMSAWELRPEIDRLAKHLAAAADRADGRNALWSHFGLTQRGTDAINAVSDDGQGAALKLILDEIQLIRRESPVVLGGNLAGNDFVRRALALLGGYQIVCDGIVQDGDTYTVHTEPMAYRVQQQFIDLAAKCGVVVAFSGLRSS